VPENDRMKIWSDVEYVYRCLADEDRTLAFETSIKELVKPGSIVLDLGTGSGIMALFAARAGATRVFTVEIGDYLFRTSGKSFTNCGYSSTIVPIHRDAMDLDFSHIEKPDVVICEMITTGLIGEMQGPVINSLKRSGIIDEHTLLVPNDLTTSLLIVDADFSFYGMQLSFPVFINYFTKAIDRSYQIYSQEKIAHKVDFSSNFEEAVKIHETIRIEKTGCINGLLLKSSTGFVGGASLSPCVSYCQPVILPAKRISVKKGDDIIVTVEYSMGEGFDSLEYEVQLFSSNKGI